jgi:hypothetical protein
LCPILKYTFIYIPLKLLTPVRTIAAQERPGTVEERWSDLVLRMTRLPLDEKGLDQAQEASTRHMRGANPLGREGGKAGGTAPVWIVERTWQDTARSRILTKTDDREKSLSADTDD